MLREKISLAVIEHRFDGDTGLPVADPHTEFRASLHLAASHRLTDLELVNMDATEIKNYADRIGQELATKVIHHLFGAMEKPLAEIEFEFRSQAGPATDPQPFIANLEKLRGIMRGEGDA